MTSSTFSSLSFIAPTPSHFLSLALAFSVKQKTKSFTIRFHFGKQRRQGSETPDLPLSPMSHQRLLWIFIHPWTIGEYIYSVYMTTRDVIGRASGVSPVLSIMPTPVPGRPSVLLPPPLSMYIYFKYISACTPIKTHVYAYACVWIYTCIMYIYLYVYYIYIYI